MNSGSAPELSPADSKIDLSADVLTAVESLKDLKNIGQATAVHKTRDTANSVTACLRDLDSKRLKCHDELEKLTIKNSILRHELAVFPDRLKAEIEAKVKAARDSNSDEIAALQDKVSGIADKLLKSIHKQQMLNLHNQVLELERKKLMKEHESLILKINEMMQDKACMQITLNETKSSLQRKLKEVEGIKRGIIDTEKEMENLRSNYAFEMKLLHKTMEIVRKKYEETTSQTEELTSRLQELRDAVFTSQLDADDKAEALGKLQEKIDVNVDKESLLRKKLFQGADALNSLRAECEGIREKTEKMKLDFDEEEAQLKAEIGLFKKETASVMEEFNALSFVYKGLKRDVKNVMADSKLQSKSLEGVRKSIQESKKSLFFYAEEGAKLTKEYGLLTKQLIELKTYHEAVVNQLQDKISDLQDEHVAEKGMKSMAKEECTKISTSLDTYTVKRSEEVIKMQNKAQVTKKNCIELTEKTSELESLLKQVEVETEMKEKVLNSTQLKLSALKSSLTEEIKTLEENIADFKEELQSRTEVLVTIEPQHTAMEKELEENEEKYDVKKKIVIGQKNQKAEVDNKLKMCKKDLDMIRAPQEKLKMDCLRCRAYTRQRLHKQEEGVREMEKQVVEAEKKVTAICAENQKIMESKQKLIVEVQRLKITLTTNQEAEKQLSTTLKYCKDQLKEKLTVVRDLEQGASSRDRVVLDDIAKLREESESRLHIIRVIHHKFEDELKQFSAYLESSAILGK